MQNEAHELIEKFFKNLKIKIDSISITDDKEEDNVIFVKIETPDSWIIIGDHGATLEDIKYLLSKMISKIHKRNIIVQLEVNDYFEEKDKRMFKFIDSKIEFAMKNNTTVVLSNYTAYERKKIHNYIKTKNLEWLRSFSSWQEDQRVMHISYINPDNRINIKNIDIDSMDI